MLKIINAMSELNIDQILSVYAENFCRNERVKRSEDDFLSYLREDFFRQRDGFCAVWVADGVYQSALRLEPYRDGLLLTALETAPNARRRGYATKLVAEMLHDLQSRGCKAVYSHVDKRNRASLKVHNKCGFRQISDSAVYLDGTITQNSCTLCCYL